MQMVGRIRDWLLRPPGAENLAEALRVAELVGSISHRDSSDRELSDELASIPPDFVDTNEVLAAFLAVVGELSHRHLALRPFPVQVAAAVAMLRGISVELSTGEGKTLVGAMVALGLVHAGHRVHILSANDYLARRDAQWMGPLLDAGGARVGAVTSQTARAVRRDAYAAEVTFVPLTEAGFDLLRDRLCRSESELVGIRPQAAVLDEADAVLLDDGRTPLVLAGQGGDEQSTDGDLAVLAAELDDRTHYEVDSDRRTLHLTEAGLEAIERRFEGADLFGADADLLTRMHVALHAEALVSRDVDYIVADEEVRLVDQARGRTAALQRWPEGLQTAIEVKEGLRQRGGVEILDQILVRDLVGQYERVVGMSGTLVTDAEALSELYDLPVGKLAPNRPCVRTDEADRLFATRADRDQAAVELVRQLHGATRPVLVATQTVAESELFAELLAEGELPCLVLNAKNDADEAAIIARAGETARITVTTQIAGRGTDIRLSPEAEEVGGLAVIGLGRFASRRLDNQLRGRSGRQGDAGSSVFLTSLEDRLLTGFVPDHRPARRLGPNGEVFDRQFTSLMDHAQRVSEGQHLSLLRLSTDYGRFLNLQRSKLLEERGRLLGTTHGLDLLDELTSRIAELRQTIADIDLVPAARLAALSCLDRAWSEHLAYAAMVREGIHLRRLAREDPLPEFNRLMVEAFSTLFDDAYADAAGLVERAPVVDGRLDLSAVGMYEPGATWTYMTTDDHFDTAWEKIGKHLFGGLTKSR